MIHEFSLFLPDRLILSLPWFLLSLVLYGGYLKR
jgi:hypothetical protein